MRYYYLLLSWIECILSCIRLINQNGIILAHCHSKKLSWGHLDKYHNVVLFSSQLLYIIIQQDWKGGYYKKPPDLQ
ncbi:hypothetical protein DESC_500063 [Desulfosarcina cetonica]|nr:hypothetical protein DESC_500063 [Desulfosarcina cetonica]